MEVVDALQKVVTDSGISRGRIARIIGIKPQSLNDRLHTNNITIKSAVEILEVVNWEVAFVPKGMRLPNGSIRINKGTTEVVPTPKSEGSD